MFNIMKLLKCFIDNGERDVISHGKLFVIESGTDGSGKATQTQMLYEALVAEGHKVIKITFPDYESDSSALVKMYLKGDFGSNPDDVNPYIASEFYAVDRYASFKTYWEKYYNEGYIILADRYTTSNMVHQGVKMKGRAKNKYLNWLYDLEYVKNKIPVPTAVLLLNLPPEVSQKLMAERLNKFTGDKEKDIHESNVEYLKKCYDNALGIAKKYKWTNISCAENGDIKDKEVIHNDVLMQVKKFLQQ